MCTELANGHKDIMSVPDPHSVSLDMTMVRDTESHAGPSTAFNFDRVFPPSSTQVEVFETMIRPLADELMRGFNCTVFAYGQTGSGKTHTMMGVPGA